MSVQYVPHGEKYSCCIFDQKINVRLRFLPLMHFGSHFASSSLVCKSQDGDTSNNSTVDSERSKLLDNLNEVTLFGGPSLTTCVHHQTLDVNMEEFILEERRTASSWKEVYFRMLSKEQEKYQAVMSSVPMWMKNITRTPLFGFINFRIFNSIFLCLLLVFSILVPLKLDGYFCPCVAVFLWTNRQ